MTKDQFMYLIEGRVGRLRKPRLSLIQRKVGSVHAR